MLQCYERYEKKRFILFVNIPISIRFAWRNNLYKLIFSILLSCNTLIVLITIKKMMMYTIAYCLLFVCIIIIIIIIIILRSAWSLFSKWAYTLTIICSYRGTQSVFSLKFLNISLSLSLSLTYTRAGTSAHSRTLADIRTHTDGITSSFAPQLKHLCLRKIMFASIVHFINSPLMFFESISYRLLLDSLKKMQKGLLNK